MTSHLGKSNVETASSGRRSRGKCDGRGENSLFPRWRLGLESVVCRRKFCVKFSIQIVHFAALIIAKRAISWHKVAKHPVQYSPGYWLFHHQYYWQGSAMSAVKILNISLYSIQRHRSKRQFYIHTIQL